MSEKLKPVEYFISQLNCWVELGKEIPGPLAYHAGSAGQGCVGPSGAIFRITSSKKPPLFTTVGVVCRDCGEIFAATGQNPSPSNI